MNKALLLLLLFLSACASTSRMEVAQNIAASTNLSRHIIHTETFNFNSYERIDVKGATAHIYIEGDGLAWVGRYTPSNDPTPKNPLALKLAAQDPSDNVVYLARPCQYVRSETCEQKYWTSHRFTSEVIAAMDEALDDMKIRHDITGFHLIGFSGGGNVAALLAARRNDIISLRTVAGNLDHALLHDIHDVSQIPDSLNAKDIAHQINHIPQHHFIGEKDKVVPPEIAQSFIEASSKTSCIRSTTVADATHQKFWSEIWPALLGYPVTCTN